MTPAASDSPAEADVCTKLFSYIDEFLKNLNIDIETIAAGIDAETVIPANKPKYVLAADRTTDNIIPRIIDLIVNSILLLVISNIKHS